MIIDISETAALVIDIVLLAVAGVTVGFIGHRLSVERLDHDGPLTRIRGWERGGAWYQATLSIRSWKDRLPEGGAIFRGGVSKRSLPGVDRAGLERFAIETRRAELVHWSLLALAPAFWLWNPPVLAVSMTAYTIIANLPFIAIQRYNRARLLRILRGRGRRGLAAAGSSECRPVGVT